MNEHFQVRMRKAVHVFCAGHFITLTDDLCEAVHGHNWTVGADIEGPPDRHGMVVDFIKLRDLLAAITARLDHHMLLPTKNRFLTVEHSAAAAGRAAEVTVRFQDRHGDRHGERRWVFPADECVLLPVENTTAEWIARWIGHELLAAMAAAGTPVTGTLRIEVDECLGQSAVWEHRP